jgi:hypothetical protein
MLSNLSDLSTLPLEFFLELPLTVFRGYLSPEHAPDCTGLWYTNEPKTASIYGHVGIYQTITPCLPILNLGNASVVSLLRLLFAHLSLMKKKASLLNVFDSAIHSLSDGQTERNSSFLEDTIIVDSLLFARSTGLIDCRIGGFGAGVLSTQCLNTTHHFEVCFFSPRQCISYVDSVMNDDLQHIKRLCMERQSALDKKKHPQKKQKRAEGFKMKLSFDD